MPSPLHLVPLMGNAVIDHFHHRLAVLLETALQSARNADGAEVIEVIRLFLATTRSHFAHEELVLRVAEIEAGPAHAALHAEIIAAIEAALASLSPASAAPELYRAIETLERVIYDHELIDDTAYRTALTRLPPPAPDWREDHAVGVPWIDRQHRDLLRRLADIHREATDGAAPEHLAALLRGFADAARDHFSDEEAELARRGQIASGHRQAHERLLGELDDMLAVWDSGKLAALAGDFLVYWLLDHVERGDKRDFVD